MHDTPSSIFRRHPWVLLQKLHTAAHWKPRETHLLRALDYYRSEISTSRNLRIVDIGCGNGLLAPRISEQGHEYLGIDAHAGFIDYCMLRYSHLARAQFACQPAENLSVTLFRGDVAVLNGVFHHLSEAQAAAMLQALRPCGAMIVLDHEAVMLTLRTVGQYVIQRLDRGRFVRKYEGFMHLAGWQLVWSERFPIRLLGYPLWPYFCNLYCGETEV